MLLFDEIHIDPYLDYKGGNIVGPAVNDKTLATSAYTFMVSSVSSSFKEVVHISPVSKITSEMLYDFIKTIIENLEEIGYIVFCTISDNNAINGKAMSHFSPTNEPNIVYLHPVDPVRPLFHLFDSVHLLKCLFNNWLNSKPDQTLCYPDFETNETKFACFAAVKNLHELEYDKLLKFGYSLNLKALFPTSLERQNVKLALKIFNPSVIEALRGFGSKIPKSLDTADFIHIITTWWKIVNVKTPLKGKHKRDIFQEPVVKQKSTDVSHDAKLVFLQKMLIWLDTWKSQNYSNKLTRQTHAALTHTIYGLLEIIEYCFEELDMNYLLLGKFQTDPLENRFGKYRQIAGGHYHVSLRQLYESEKRLRIQSIMTLKSRNYGDIAIDKFYELTTELTEHDQGIHPQDGTLDQSLPKMSIENKDFCEIEDIMPVVTYLGGYCCYTALKKLKCDFCKDKLVYNEEFIVEDQYDLINRLNRGGLLYPREQVVDIISFVYILFNKLLSEHEDIFLKAFNKRSFLLHLFLTYLIEHQHLTNFEGCNDHTGHDVVKLILSSVSNTLLKNYCGKHNNRLSKNKKRKLDTFSK